jgi:hypothetical protein
MFERLLALWANAKAEVPHFAYYLTRHIELDGDSHGPWSQEMLTTLAGQSESNWQEASSAAKQRDYLCMASRKYIYTVVVASRAASAGCFCHSLSGAGVSPDIIAGGTLASTKPPRMRRLLPS